MKDLVKFSGPQYPEDEIEILYAIFKGCRFMCNYCFAYDNSKRDTDLQTQYKIIDVFFRLKKPFRIYLWGGEPTEYEHIHDVIEYIFSKPSQYFKGVEIQTNLDITLDDLQTYCKYDNFKVSTSIHINFLKRDSITDIVNKLDILHDNNILNRVDFMLSRDNPDKHRELNDIFKTKKYFNLVEYTYNYMEINSEDTYTGAYNTYEQYRDLYKDKDQHSFTLEYDDGTKETCSMSDLFPRTLSFKGWECSAGKTCMSVEHNGDWAVCNVKKYKGRMMGNILTSPSRWLAQTRVPFICDEDKCDGCWIQKRVRV